MPRSGRRTDLGSQRFETRFANNQRKGRSARLTMKGACYHRASTIVQKLPAFLAFSRFERLGLFCCTMFNEQCFQSEISEVASEAEWRPTLLI